MAKELICKKSGEKIGPNTEYVETDFGDIFKTEHFKCEKCNSAISGAYVCLNDAGEPRKYKYENGHYYLPACAQSLNKDAPAPAAPKKEVCYICETELTGEYMQLLDGKKIKPECLKKLGVDMNDPNSAKLLRTRIERYKRGEPLELNEGYNDGPKDDGGFKERMAQAEANAAEQKKKDDEYKARQAAREQEIKDKAEQKKQEESAAVAKAAADKDQAEADKVKRLEDKGKWTIAELKDAKLRTEYFVPDLTEGKPETLLSDADFQTAFGMDREAFEKLAGWKQKDARKKQGFF